MREEVTAVLYAAKSTADVRGSLETQRDDTHRLAEAEGMEVVASYSDEAASAFKQSRGEGLARAKEHAAALAAEHGSCALIVQHTDRLARGDAIQAAHLIEVYLWALKSNVKLRSVQDDHNLDDMLRAVLIGERNWEDSQRKSQAVKAGMKRSVARGQRQGGTVPYGFKEGEPPIVESIFRDFVAGHSMTSIARRLYSAGVPTRRGGRWDPSTIRAMLRNPCYIGMIRWDDQLVQCERPSLIDEQLWNEAQALLESHSSSKRGRPTAARALFRAGLLRCSCGASLAPRTQRHGVVWYRCTTRKLYGMSVCSMPELRAEDIDTKVIEYFLRCGVDVEATKERLDQALSERNKSARAVLQSAERAERQAAEALARVRSDYKSGKLRVEDWIEFKDELESELKAATAELQRLRAVQPGPILGDVESEVLTRLAEIRDKSNDLDAVRAALTRMFERFVVHVDGDQGRIEAVLKPQSIATVDEEIRPVLKPTALELEPQRAAGNNEGYG